MDLLRVATNPTQETTPSISIIPIIYLRGSLMWMYRSREMAHKFSIDAVEHMTSKATHVSQNWAPKTQ